MDQEKGKLLTHVASTHHGAATTVMSKGWSEPGLPWHLNEEQYIWREATKGKGTSSQGLPTGKVPQSFPAAVTKHQTGQLINSRNFMLTVMEPRSLGSGCQHSWVGAPSWYKDNDFSLSSCGGRG